MIFRKTDLEYPRFYRKLLSYSNSNCLNMKALHLLILSAFCCLLWTQTHAQTADSTILWRIVTTDDNEYIGEVLSRDSETLQLQTDRLGVLTIRVRDIRVMEQVNQQQMVGEEIWLENPQATRYLWNTNGYGIRQGEGYYQNLWVLFNQVSIGVVDHFSVSLGTVPLFLFGGLETPVWVIPKFSIPVVKDKFNLGGGILAATVVGLQEGWAGVAFGSATYGSRDRNVNFGLGYGFADGNWSNTPVITISGMHRYSRRGYILTENYLFGFGDFTAGVISVAGRTVWDGISLDYGGFVPLGDVGTVIVLPWLSLIIPFGQK